MLRTVGDDYEVRAFATYAAVAIALIGTLPDTLHDRSVVIELKRRLLKEKIAPFRFDRAGHLDVLARMAARWAADNAERVAATDPKMPKGVINRAGRQLAAVGGDCGRRRRPLARPLGHRRRRRPMLPVDDEAASAAGTIARRHPGRLRYRQGEKPAADMFGAEQIEIASAELVKILVGLDGRPWAEMGRSASR